MPFSTWIMKLAARIAPKSRDDWAAAMSAEYAMLKGGRLGWALGCLITAAGWRWRADALYLLGIAAAIEAMSHVFRPYYSEATINLFPNAPLTGFISLASYLVAWVPFWATCSLLGLWRPDRVVATGLLAMMVCVVDAYATFHFILHWRFGYIHYMDLPPVVGELAVFAYAFGGAWLGACVRWAFSRKTARG